LIVAALVVGLGVLGLAVLSGGEPTTITVLDADVSPD
jgi:hypothetical protein